MKTDDFKRDFTAFLPLQETQFGAAGYVIGVFFLPIPVIRLSLHNPGPPRILVARGQ
jgi:hypothetical protein